MGHKMHGRRLYGGHRTVGSIYEVQPLGNVSDPHTPMGAIVPVLAGAAASAATVLGLRYGMQPTTSTQAKVMQYAPWLGLLTGQLVAMIFGYSTGRASGLTAAGASVVTTGVMLTADWAAGNKLKAVAGNDVAAKMAPYGLGAIVAEYGSMPGRPRALSGGGPLGEIVWQREQQMRGGEQVTLRGITQSAYGTPGFQIHP